MPFDPITLGRTGLTVGRLGIAASYGVPAAAVERAFEHGVNYLYWGSWRREAFAQAIRNLAPQRERFVLLLQSFSPVAGWIGKSIEQALRKLRLDYADVLLLGMWNRRPPPRIVEACRKLKQRGLVRFLALSTHNRPLVPELARDADFDIVHFRYNAVHRGAEQDVFPHLPVENRPGMVAFTATCWGRLLRTSGTGFPACVPTASGCYRFVLSQPAVDLCLTGPASALHAEQALEALRKGPMSEDELAWMRRAGDAIYGKR